MLYIISFQSISCREASPASPRPHKGPPEGVSARAEGAGLHPVHTPLLRKEFSTVLRAVPRVGSLSGLWAGSDRSSGRAVSSVIPSIFHPVSHTLLSSALWPVFPSIFHPVSLTLLSSVIWPVFPSIFRPVSLTLLSSVLWPVPQNNSQAGPRGGLCHDHPAHRYISAIPACRTIQQSPSNRPLNGPRPVLATASLSTDTSVPSRRGKAVIYHPFATATLPTSTSGASRRAEQSHTLSQTGLKLALDRSSPRPPCPQVPQSHPGVAKPSSIIPLPRPPCPQVPQCHPHVPNNPTISLKPASNRTSTGPRHGDPIHKYLSAIPTWQSRHLSSLRHGHPAHRYSSAIPTCRDVPKPVSERCSERFLRRSSDRLPVRARLSGGRGEKEISK